MNTAPRTHVLVSALDSVRDLGLHLTRDDFVEAHRCVVQWSRLAARESAALALTTPSAASPSSPGRPVPLVAKIGIVSTKIIDPIIQQGEDDARTLLSLLAQRGLPFRPLLVALCAFMSRLPEVHFFALSFHHAHTHSRSLE